MNEVLCGFKCLICREEMILHTDAPQEGRRKYYAYGGEKVICPNCGATAQAEMDTGGAYIDFDETTNHNVKCAEGHKSPER